MEINSTNNIFSSIIVVTSPVLNATFKTNTTNDDAIEYFVSDKVEDAVIDKCCENLCAGNLSFVEVMVGGPMVARQAKEDTTVKVIKPDFNTLNALISACNEAFTRKDTTAIDTYESQYGELPKEIRNNIDSIISTK